jgi:hypothetical protein
MRNIVITLTILCGLIAASEGVPLWLDLVAFIRQWRVFVFWMKLDPHA